MTGPAAAIDRDFFARPVLEIARDVIGLTLLVDGAGGRIVEVEAYDQDDPASHSHRGCTERNAVMFGPPGHVYVYRSHGIHWCMNLVCDTGRASALLLRALEPVAGVERMAQRRGTGEPRLLCSGPGRLCQALGVTIDLNGAALDEPPFRLGGQPGRADVVSGPRIGITKAVDVPWRFCERGSRFLSRPVPSRPAGAGGAGRQRRPAQLRGDLPASG